MGRRLMCAFHSRVARRCLSGFITRQSATKRGLAPFFMRQKRPPFSLQMSPDLVQCGVVEISENGLCVFQAEI